MVILPNLHITCRRHASLQAAWGFRQGCSKMLRVDSTRRLDFMPTNGQWLAVGRIPTCLDLANLSSARHSSHSLHDRAFVPLPGLLNQNLSLDFQSCVGPFLVPIRHRHREQRRTACLNGNETSHCSKTIHMLSLHFAAFISVVVVVLHVELLRILWFKKGPPATATDASKPGMDPPATALFTSAASLIASSSS